MKLLRDVFWTVVFSFDHEADRPSGCGFLVALLLVLGLVVCMLLAMPVMRGWSQ